MAIIKLTTFINADFYSCFELARSIDIHLQSMQHTNEKVIAGKKEGTLNQGETVTWMARHFGLRWHMEIKMNIVSSPSYFEDIMVRGPFKFLTHRHHFIEQKNGTMMLDIFHYQAPFGILGKAIECLFLDRYMIRLLQTRNACLKKIVESKQKITY